MKSEQKMRKEYKKDRKEKKQKHDEKNVKIYINRKKYKMQ